MAISNAYSDFLGKFGLESLDEAFAKKVDNLRTFEESDEIITKRIDSMVLRRFHVRDIEIKLYGDYGVLKIIAMLPINDTLRGTLDIVEKKQDEINQFVKWKKSDAFKDLDSLMQNDDN